MALQSDNWPLTLRRLQGDEPPADRRLHHDISLDGDSLSSLFPGSWLDDTVVNHFFRYLCLSQPGQSVTLDSTALDVVRQMRESELETGTAPTPAEIDEPYHHFRTLAATVTGNRGLVFMPFCVNNHWILAVADFEHQVIRVYDSMATRDESEHVEMSPCVDAAILPIVKRILSFCLEEDRWHVEKMWLPIEPTGTECGVYICMMGLQHSHMRRFNDRDYVPIFPDENGNVSRYGLDWCFWLAARRVILQVCRRALNSRALWDQSLEIEQDIIRPHFQGLLDAGPAQQVASPISYYNSRLVTLQKVLFALLWVSDSIVRLATPQQLDQNQVIQIRARQVDLTPSGEPFRNQIADQAVDYAWHDVDALIQLWGDIDFAYHALKQEFQDSPDRRANSQASQTELTPAGVPTGECPSTTDLGTPPSSGTEESESEQ